MTDVKLPPQAGGAGEAKPMPEWPKPSAFNLPRDYERACADYWEARCRVAVEALETAAQARSEVRHAKEVGPNWYTRGERGMHAQVLMWDGKAGEAAAKALSAIGPLPPKDGR